MRYFLYLDEGLYDSIGEKLGYIKYPWVTRGRPSEFKIVMIDNEKKIIIPISIKEFKEQYEEEVLQHVEEFLRKRGETLEWYPFIVSRQGYKRATQLLEKYGVRWTSGDRFDVWNPFTTLEESVKFINFMIEPFNELKFFEADSSFLPIDRFKILINALVKEEG